MIQPIYNDTGLRDRRCLLLGRLDSKAAGDLLGFALHDISILIAHKHLKPLGNPVPNAVKYFAAVTVVELAQDVQWLDRATRIVSAHWRTKNGVKRAFKADPSFLDVPEQ